MQPVTLVSLPNVPYLVGTFDTALFQTWWKSSDLTGVERIIKGIQTYGTIHVALTKNTNGTWSIFQSMNSGVTWSSVFNHAYEIFDVVQISYGWLIINCADGFYESTNSGTTWTLVLGLPTAPIASAIANVGFGDILVCTDGASIWRSLDVARTWTKVCTISSIRISDTNGQTERYSTYWTGLTIPCIAGANGRILASAGPYLLISEDNGATWECHRYWCGTITNTASPDYVDFPDPAYVWSRIWPAAPLKMLVSQILVSRIDGPSGSEVHFVIKCNDVLLHSGESGLRSWTFITRPVLHYTGQILMDNYGFNLALKQDLTPGNNTQLSSSEVLLTGTNYNTRMLFSSQTSNGVTSLRYSLDGGTTWVTINVNALQVFDGNVPLGTNPFVDDNFSRNTWIAGPCNNYGTWTLYELFCRRNLSFDMDYTTLVTHTKTYGSTLHSVLRKLKQPDFDLLIQNRHTKTCTANVLNQLAHVVGIHATEIVKKAFPATYAPDIVTVLRYLKTYTPDILLQKPVNHGLLFRCALQSAPEETFGMTVNIQETIVQDILSNSQRFSPQFPDIGSGYENRPYEIFDSRRNQKF
jgi:hypothetical protein